MYIRELSTFNDLSTLKSDVVPFFMYVPMCVCVCACVFHVLILTYSTLYLLLFSLMVPTVQLSLDFK